MITGICKLMGIDVFDYAKRPPGPINLKIMVPFCNCLTVKMSRVPTELFT